MKNLNEYLVIEGQYGPAGKEADKILESPKCKKWKEILDKYNEIGKKNFPKFFKFGFFMILQFPSGDDKKMACHMDYNDIYVSFANTNIYYIITSDKLKRYPFEDNTNIFGSKSAKFFYDLIKELNPDTKIKLENLEVDYN